MSEQVDHSKPFTKEQIEYFHAWSMDWAIEENLRVHGQAEAHGEGGEVDISGALADAGINPPEAPPNPVPVGQGNVDEPVLDAIVDDAPVGDDGQPLTLQEQVESLTVDELKANLKDLGEPVSGNKDDLQARLIAAVEKSEAAANDDGTQAAGD